MNFWKPYQFLKISVFLLPLLAGSAHAQTPGIQTDPWIRLSLPQTPDWLKVSGHQRTRYESLSDQFRFIGHGSDQILAFRTTLKMEFDLDCFDLVVEMIDSRQELADTGSPLSPGIVDTLDILQAYVELEVPNRFCPATPGRFRFGRQTMDIGSRRLVARNRFRNTINSFTGVHGEWTAPSGETLRAFYVLPVERLPFDFQSLMNNDHEWDDEDFGTQFWGIHYLHPEVRLDIDGELYLYGLHEEDRPNRPTRDRDLYTTGIRLFREPKPGCYDFEWESVYQTGESRSSILPTNTQDLDHEAHFHHVEAGYSFDRCYSPNLALLFDYASGDKDPNDNKNNRFDTLYGARRFDYGPTGIYGAFARSNLISPGYRLLLKPRKTIDFGFAHRFNWLASDTDAWTTAGVRDPSGQTGTFIGHQIECRVRWKAIPEKLDIEFGAAHLFAGEFMKDAPNSNGEGDATYGYVQTVLTF
ncbi:MAG: alginate export family protein [Candidatus Omnitrophica bacterium]|nr:alginate export family protein [Candidatus Omnitrophota bacterium]MCA9430766.1 alginate export family protein [Candidatus Omnitrophota bacterium]